MDALLGLDDPRRRDQLHRPGDLLDRLDAADASPQDALLASGHRLLGSVAVASVFWLSASPSSSASVAVGIGGAALGLGGRELLLERVDRAASGRRARCRPDLLEQRAVAACATNSSSSLSNRFTSETGMSSA